VFCGSYDENMKTNIFWTTMTTPQFKDTSHSQIQADFSKITEKQWTIQISDHPLPSTQSLWMCSQERDSWRAELITVFKHYQFYYWKWFIQGHANMIPFKTFWFIFPSKCCFVMNSTLASITHVRTGRSFSNQISNECIVSFFGMVISRTTPQSIKYKSSTMWDHYTM
jgi:phosphomevalonate kinase